MTVWQDDRLLLGQTCGLPYMLGLKEVTSLIGTPAYCIDCGAGSYFSVLIVALPNDAEQLSELKGARFGYSNAQSQSGFAAFLHRLQQPNVDDRVIAEYRETGSHRQSIEQVASGAVDIAAIDAVSWELAKRHEPAAQQVRVIGRTTPTPGLPFITRKRPASEVRKIHMAVIDAMASLDEATREDLLLIGFAEMKDADYEILGTRYSQIPPAFIPDLHP